MLLTPEAVKWTKEYCFWGVGRKASQVVGIDMISDCLEPASAPGSEKKVAGEPLFLC